MKLRMTRLLLAAMICLGIGQALADEITVSEDKASTYVPTTIVNDGIPQPQRLKRLNEIAIQLLSPRLILARRYGIIFAVLREKDECSLTYRSGRKAGRSSHASDEAEWGSAWGGQPNPCNVRNREIISHCVLPMGAYATKRGSFGIIPAVQSKERNHASSNGSD